jgi:hypothetical protein
MVKLAETAKIHPDADLIAEGGKAKMDLLIADRAYYKSYGLDTRRHCATL